MRYTLTNVGHSLAKYVSVWTALDLNGGWKDAQDRICSYPKLPQNSKSDYGYLLFPGQTVLDQTPAQATSEDVTRALNPTVSPLAIKKMVAVDIVVCVDYVSTIDMQHHQTRLVRGVLSDEGTENAALVGTFVADRQYGKLAFVPHLHGDSAD